MRTNENEYKLILVLTIIGVVSIVLFYKKITDPLNIEKDETILYETLCSELKVYKGAYSNVEFYRLNHKIELFASLSNLNNKCRLIKIPYSKR